MSARIQDATAAESRPREERRTTTTTTQEEAQGTPSTTVAGYARARSSSKSVTQAEHGSEGEAEGQRIAWLDGPLKVNGPGPILKRSGTDRFAEVIAGSANRLLASSSRLFIGSGRRPVPPGANTTLTGNKKEEAVPQHVPKRIFVIGEDEKTSFEAASAVPHRAAAWSAPKQHKREDSSRSDDRDPDGHVTRDSEDDRQQPSPNSTAPSPDSLLDMLGGQPDSSATSTEPSSVSHSAVAPADQVSPKDSRFSSFGRLFSKPSRSSLSPAARETDEQKPHLAHKLLRRPSDRTMGSQPVTQPAKRRDHPEPAGKSSYVQPAAGPSFTSMPPPHAPPHAEFKRPTPAVHFESPRLEGDAPPASPGQVLERTEAPDSSHPSSRHDKSEPSLARSETAADSLAHVSSTTESSASLVRDRVLVSTGYTHSEDLPPNFNEAHARSYPISMERWRECVLVARHKKLEIWTSHHVGQRVRSTHKLIDQIPITPRTTLSLFSPGDYTFIMTCPEYSRRRLLASRIRSGLRSVRSVPEALNGKAGSPEDNNSEAVKGTAVFAIRAQCPSMAQDFYWHIWSMMGNSPPASLQVSLPMVGTHFAFQLPQTLSDARQLNPQVSDLDRPYAALTPNTLIEAALQSISGISQWMQMSEHAESKGLRPALAWRRGNYLDWVRHDTTVTGKPRPWSLLAGFALSSETRFGLFDSLEIRLAAPYPKTVAMGGDMADEPMSVEGYAVRLHGVGNRDRVYLFSLGTQLFILNAGAAQPPPPPGSNPQPTAQESASNGGFFQHIGKAFVANKPSQEVHDTQPQGPVPNEDEEDEVARAERLYQFEEHEKDRFLRMVKSARGFIDLRDLETVLLEDPSQEAAQYEQDPSSAEALLKEDDDAGDQATVIDLKMRRGRQLRLEVFGEKAAIQWITSLRKLNSYWKARTTADAIEQTSFNPMSSEYCRVAAQTKYGKDIVKNPSSSDNSGYLNLAYNWSILTGSRGLTLSGMLFVKRERRKQYKRRLCVLMRGCLFFFKTMPFGLAAHPAQNTWHHNRGMWDLSDSYVISQGALCSEWKVATDDLNYRPGENFGPRVYEDGLRSADEDEDCTLVVWKKIGESELGRKSKVLVLRARSKMERDQWAFALDNEIERLVRIDRKKPSPPKDTLV